MVQTGHIRVLHVPTRYQYADIFTKGQRKKKKAKKVVFSVYFRYDGIFFPVLLKYVQGEMKEVNDTNFDEMSYEHLLNTVKRIMISLLMVGVIFTNAALDDLSIRVEIIDDPFRLYASWMSSEHSFRIKSFISEHKCCRNYNLRSLVTYKRIGLLDVVNDWLPEAEHRKHTRHVYANFKKKYSRLQYQRLFWAATSCTLEQQFELIIDHMRQIDKTAYDYLIQRNPNSWSRAFFEMDTRCAAFEKEISESVNRAVLGKGRGSRGNGGEGRKREGDGFVKSGGKFGMMNRSNQIEDPPYTKAKHRPRCFEGYIHQSKVVYEAGQR
nr:hypothetical protein CTI12_AA098400 [Tanacetum cinerariifolium]